MRLTIENFAQIESADIDFGAEGDLTILVGQQATGKSLILQWLKLLTDPLVVRADWERFGSNWKTDDRLRPLDLFFGEGLGRGYRAETRISLDGRLVVLEELFNRRRSKIVKTDVESTYFVPAHRALLLADGWPRNFQQHVPGTPYVARAQSERLARWLSDAGKSIFPIANRLHSEVRELFDEAIFHKAKLEVDKSSPQSRLILRVGDSSTIPYMAWTAGQREFVPLLVALYELMPSGAASRMRRASECDIRTVILEEPELGLHPKALFAVGVALLHLMSRGYRVVVSSHSPLMVDFAWALNRFRRARDPQRSLEKSFLDAFDLRSTKRSKDLARDLTGARARTYYLTYRKNGKVNAKDISELAAYSADDEQSSWGELLKYSTRLAEVVGQLELDLPMVAARDALP